MDQKENNKTQDTLLRVIELAKAYGEKLQAKRELRLWKDINVPCKLSDTINRLTKAEMDSIRKNLELKNLSALRKNELAAKLVNMVPLKYKQVIYNLDKERYDLLKSIVKNSGSVLYKDLSVSKIESLMAGSIVFPGVYNNQKVLAMPQELINVFLETDGAELEKTVQLNTEWIRLTHGFLYYYGVADIRLIEEKINQLTGEEMDFYKYIKVMSDAIDYYGQIRYCQYGFCDHRVFDVKEVFDEHKKRPTVEYYPFARRQLLKASEPDYIEKTPAMNKFTSFLSIYYDLTSEDKDEIALQLNNMMNMGANTQAIIDYLQSLLEFPSFEFVQELASQIMDVHNNTRMWILKGHTPNELFQEEMKFLRPLPDKPFMTGQTSSKVVDINTRKKIGRNDP